MMVEISTALRVRLIDLAAMEPDREVCGLLLGRGARIEALVEARNVAADPTRTFEVEPRTQIDAQKAARGGALPVIGCYHSHPSGDVTPSAHDRELAEQGSFWLIMAAGELAAWRRGESGFDPVELTDTAD